MLINRAHKIQLQDDNREIKKNFSDEMDTSDSSSTMKENAEILKDQKY